MTDDAATTLDADDPNEDVPDEDPAPSPKNDPVPDPDDEPDTGGEA